MKEFGLADLADNELLSLYGDVMDEIQSRGLSRGMNNPIGDLAERLAAQALNATVMDQSTKGFDLLGSDGVTRYEVKGLRIRKSGSRQLSAIRGLEERHFDYLVGILFNKDCTVRRVAAIPWSVVRERAKYIKRTNSWKFHLPNKVWSLRGVEDLTHMFSDKA